MEQLEDDPCCESESECEEIRYVECGVCSTILLVNVPYSKLCMVVSVRCGNCSGLLSVNMANPSFIPFHLLTSLTTNHNMSHLHLINLPPDHLEDRLRQQHYSLDLNNNNNNNTTSSSDLLMTSYHHNNINQNHDIHVDDDVTIIIPPTPLVNKPPEKKQRAPSAYNQFIKEEIRRLKADNPAMPHKEAFKTAAKNWAHLPPVNNVARRQRSGA